MKKYWQKINSLEYQSKIYSVLLLGFWVTNLSAKKALPSIFAIILLIFWLFSDLWTLKIKALKEEKCELCGLTHWLNGKIPLELDHIDSNHHNNSLDNLQILCPNCHAVVTIERRK